MNKESEQTTQDEVITEPDQLDDVHISDEDLEASDKEKVLDKKSAKKRAKLLRTPEEKKRVTRRKVLASLGVLFALIAVLFVVPATRWPILNALGLRGTLNLTAQDKDSNAPITEVSVYLDDAVVGSTDSNGEFSLSNIRLGEHSILLQKQGYSRFAQNITVAPGKKEQIVQLEAVGIKMTASIKDWLTSEPIAKATVSYQKNISTSDKKGQTTLIVPPSEEKIEIKVEAKGYIARKVMVDPSVTNRELTLVSDAKNYFISKRSGQFDIFSSNIDGSSQKKIIDATGKEDKNFLQFTIHKGNKQALLIATREVKNQNERVVAGIYAVDLQGAALKKIDEGSDIQVIGWINDSIIYRKTDPALKYDDKNFTKIMQYNVLNSSLNQIAQANYFPIASTVGTSVFYMPADGYRTLKNVSLTSIDLSNNVRRTYLKDKQPSYGTHTQYGILQLETLTGASHEINSFTGVTTSIDGQPGEAKVFAQSQNSQQVAYTDKRDGKGALIVRSVKDNSEKVVVKIAGLTSPVRWVSNRLIVGRIVTNEETADYVIDVPTGKYVKVVDVSNVGQYNYGSL